ncbi:hypothetical protein B0H14DRAFT_3084551 [Mycena olivaceomarginata]|nr:hypothetical protein B0H14DRAFT_3084551 [Mycena olivaceomarginata]
MMLAGNADLSSMLGWVSIACWLLGDLSNLVGAALAHLLPTVIIIAVLVRQYTLCDITLLVQVYYYRRKALLPGNNGGNSSNIVSTRVLILRYTAALIFVFTTGVVAWWISRNSEKTEEPPKQPTATVDWTLGSRIPQIAKNLQTQCEGLSPALFFAIVGNLTYSLSIIAKSTDRDYLIKRQLAGRCGLLYDCDA